MLENKNIFIQFVYEPLREADGTISGVMALAHEITEQVLAKKKIEENNKRNDMLMMESPFAFSVMKGKDLVVTLANDLTKEIWGKGKDVEGKTLIEILPEIIGQPFTDVMHKVLTTGIPVYLNEILTKLMYNGKLEERYFNIVYQPYHEPDATISGVTAIGYEVTETVLARIKIQESEERFRVLMNVMPQKITHADTSGNVVFFNQQWLDETGYTLEELKNGGWAKSLHPDELQEITENWLKSVETGHIFDMEIRVKNNEGDYKWHLSRAVPVIDENGKRIMWVGSTTDIHELKEAKSKAEEAVKAKQQFLSNMSHEIRTPMNAIVGFTHVVLKTDLNKAQKEYIKAIKVSGDALIVLINDILDLAQVDAGKMTFQQLPFNLSDSISAMLLVFEIKLKEKNIILIKNYDATIPEVLIGDPIRLRQIILNLLSNAVKFTEKGTITIGVHLLDEDSEKVTIEFNVTDTGIGIPENKLPHIFDNFEQAHTDTGKSFGGTGLGLAIFKQLVEHQGGSISVKTKEGEGSTFSFILPFKKTTNKMPVKPEPKIITSPEMIKAKVLVAEDVHLNRLLIKIILADLGFEVETADNGKIAIEKLKENNYDIILMDLQMPEMDGFEATIYIRNTMRSQIPIIALTADVTAADVEKSKVVGMNDYISKPIDEKLLYSKIIEHLRYDKCR